MLDKLWLWITGSIVGIYTLFTSVILYRLRLRGSQAMYLYDIVSDRGKQFILKEDVTQGVLPREYTAFCWLDGILMYYQITERMLRAGFQGVDNVVHVTLLRWQVNKLKSLLKVIKPKDNTIDIYILQPWDAEKIGTLQIPKVLPTLYANPALYQDIETDIQYLIDGKISKFGAIFYGSQGDGKSFMIRYLSLKYKLPVYIVSFNVDTTNHSLIRMFSKVEGPAVILFEDFDNYFDKRKCLLKESKFTFDTLLNIIDGLFSSPSGLVMFMTANNINKIDLALRSRPSRFKYVKHITSPSTTIRDQVFVNMGGNSLKASDMTKGFTLDMTLFVRSRIIAGSAVEKAVKEAKEYYCIKGKK